MENYKSWEVYDTMPDGYRIDKTVGSPLTGYVFATNGSPLKGGKRVLVRVKKEALPESEPAKSDIVEALMQPAEHVQVIDETYARTVNELARKRFEQRLLADIRVDLMICEIEGWDKLGYVRELQSIIGGLARRKRRGPQGLPCANLFEEGK